jgi:hypothetical protein
LFQLRIKDARTIGFVGAIALSHEGRLSDGNGLVEPSPPLTAEERRAIAAYMVDRWTTWGLDEPLVLPPVASTSTSRVK